MKCAGIVTSEELDSIQILDISDRMKNLLIKAGIMRIEQLVAFDETSMSRYQWFHSKVRRSEFDDAVQKAHMLLSTRKQTQAPNGVDL